MLRSKALQELHRKRGGRSGGSAGAPPRLRWSTISPSRGSTAMRWSTISPSRSCTALAVVHRQPLPEHHRGAPERSPLTAGQRGAWFGGLPRLLVLDTVRVMPAPKLSHTISLQTLREELVF